MPQGNNRTPGGLHESKNSYPIYSVNAYNNAAYI